MRKNEIKILQCFLFIFVFAFSVFSETREISGLVMDVEDDSPLQGANVFLKSSNLGTVTDTEGFFRFEVDNQSLDDTLIVNYLGYQEYRIHTRDFINNSVIGLKVDILAMEKEIAVFADKFDLGKQDIPHSAFVIDAKQIDRYGTNEMSDLFKADPSVRVEGNDLDGRKIQIRGSDPDEVNVYIDGILINNIGLDNTADLSIISPANIQKLEILKGANLLLLGSGAFGGVVNITSRKKIEREYSVNLKYGSFSNKYVATELNLPLPNNIYLNYYGSLNTMSPEIELFPSERFEEKTKNEQIRTVRQNHHLTLFYTTPKSQYMTKVIGYLLDYDKPDWQNKRKNLLVAGNFKGSIFDIDNFDISLNYLFNDDVITRDAPRDAKYLSTFLSQRVHLKVARNFVSLVDRESNFNFQVISEYFHDELFNKSEVDLNNQKSRLYNGYLYDNRASVGAVVSFANEMNESGSMYWNTFGGMRGDFLANGKWYKVSSFGVEVNFDQTYWKISPYFNYGDNIKIPTLQDNAYLTHLKDLAAAQEGLDPITLIPENSTSYEVGINYSYLPANYYFENIDVNLALFSNHVYNKLLKTQIENIIVEKQLGEVSTKGIEATLRVNKLFSSLNLSLSYGTLDVDNLILYAYKPESKFSFQGEFYTNFGFYISGVFFNEGKSVAWEYNDQNDIEIVTLDSYYDVDFTVGYNFKVGDFNTSIKASGYNVFDNAGFQYYYLKKRFYQVGFSVAY